MRPVPVARRTVLGSTVLGSAVVSGSVLLSGSVLGAAVAAGALTGCESAAEPDPPTRPNPLLAVLATTESLLADYDAVFAQHHNLARQLGSLRSDHHNHAVELRRQLGDATPSASASGSARPAPSRTPVPAAAPAAVRALADAERRAQHSAALACLRVPARYATLVGSISACRASHVAVLT